MGYADKAIEQKRSQIKHCETMRYEIQSKPVKSRLDQDKLEILRAQMLRIEREIEDLRR